MTACLSKSLHSSSHFMSNMEQEGKVTEKQGIVTILGSDSERTKAPSLRRTLSADMSSKKWLAQQGFAFSPMKKIASSEELSMSMEDSNSSSSSDEEDDHFRNRKAHQQQRIFHIWTPIDQEDQIVKKKKQEMAEQGKFDIWSSLVTRKDGAETEANKTPEAPYVHPLVKKQSSSLKGKSLEVCTESLGSETGSEGFASEAGDIEVADPKSQVQVAEIQQQQVEEHKQKQVEAEFRVVKYNSAAAAAIAPAAKKTAAVARSFPPPIPSLTGSDGASLRIKSHRDSGRVVLEAVSMPSTNNFRAQRQDGRLLLTFVSATPSSAEEHSENEEFVAKENKEELELEEKFVNFEETESEEEDEEEEEEEEIEVVERVVEKRSGIKEIEIVMEEAPKMLTSRVTNVHRLALMMKKPVGLANRTHGWAAANKFNQVVKFGGDDEEGEVTIKPATLAQSLPPRPSRVARLIPKSPAAPIATAATAASLNAYEYYWRAKPTAALNNPLSPPMKNSKDQMANQQQQQLLVLRGKKGDPLSKGCKEPRRSLLFWEPYCIATT